MSIVSRPPGHRSSHDMGATLGYACERCGEMPHGETTGIVHRRGTEAVNHMLRRVEQCPSCARIFCRRCSIRADIVTGRPEGAVDFTCPFCRAMGIPA